METPTLEAHSKTTSNKKMSRKIKKVAVLGSGVMGAGIAAHFANIGLDVLMLDIVPFNLTDEEKKIPAKRNSIVNNAKKALLKSKPAALYRKSFADRIKVGNFDDNMKDIADCDWIIEVVIERLDIKQQVFEKVEKYRKEGALITSNTSSIPIHLMAEGRSDDFKKNFCGTHFFNPPRYLKLFEIIPTPDTDPSVVDFLTHYSDVYLGKTPVLCKDTPAFIANRVGVYAMSKIYQLTEELDMTIEEVDRVTGKPMGRPRTGVFRLGDLVGHDTSAKVVEVIRTRCEDDEQKSAFTAPSYTKFLEENKFYGDKSGQGFYKKTNDRDDKGKRIVLALDLKKLEYRPKERVKFASLDATKQIENLSGRIKSFFKHDDKAALLVQKSLGALFAYVSNRIPEISDHLYSIDDALRAGFAWEVGPFQYWDMLGAKAGIEAAEKEGQTVAQWVHDMVAAGHDTFYKLENGVNHYYDITSKSYKSVPGAESFIILDNLRATQKPVYENAEAVAHDIGDGVLCLEFRSKMNSIGEGVLKGINDTIQLAEDEGWRGVVIGNNAEHFSVGANLMMIAMMAYQQEFDELNFAVNAFQQTTMRCRYSSIPVVAATQGYVFGGGCETIMHCDAAVCATESYIGLVEVGVGLIPGGGGTKEFALRASDGFVQGDVQIPSLIEKFKTLAMASVATSAHEAFKHGYLNSKDSVCVNTARNIGEAKRKVLELTPNYTQPIKRTDIDVLGRTGLAALYTASHSLKLGKFASEHDIKIANKIAYVLCGGDLSAPQKVSEQYLLDIEREAFLSLCGEQKTLERIQHMLQTNKPLRN